MLDRGLIGLERAQIAGALPCPPPHRDGERGLLQNDDDLSAITGSCGMHAGARASERAHEDKSRKQKKTPLQD